MISIFSISSCIRILWLSLLFITLTQAQEQETVTLVTVTETQTSPTPASYTSLSEFKDTVLSISNDYRREHDACTLTWNDTLADYSRNWAKQCKWKHSKGPYGENLSFGYPNASSAIAVWGEERKMYNFKLPTGFSEETGHFTQLVWKATTQVGCAAVNCGYDDDAQDKETGNFEKALGWYVVCEYAPAGNVMGKHKKWFKMNVVPERARGGGSDGRTEPGGHGDDGDEDEDNAAVGRRYIGRVGFWLVMVHGVFFML